MNRNQTPSGQRTWSPVLCGARHRGALPLVLALVLSGPIPASAQNSEPLHAIEEILRFPVIDPAETAFPDVGAMTLGPDGRIYLGLHHLRSIRIFEPDGTFLRAVGGPGGGDGKMGYLNALWWAGDTLIVEDRGFRRLVYFDASGAPLGSSDFQNVVPTDRLRTLFGLADEEEAAGEDLIVQRGDRRLGWNSPYRFDALLARSPNGDRAAVLQMSHPDAADGSMFTVSAVRIPSGERLFESSMAYTPFAVDPAEVVEALARGFAAALQIPPEELVDDISSQLDLPASAPPALDLALGTDGAVWVRVWRTPGMPPRWMELDEEGRAARTVEFPAEGEPVLFDGDLVYFTTSIEGTLHLVSYRIDPDTSTPARRRATPNR
jgi:hypothetical protein